MKTTIRVVAASAGAAALASGAALALATTAATTTHPVTLCVTRSTGVITAPGSTGQCGKQQTTIKVASDADVAALAGRVDTAEGNISSLQSGQSSQDASIAALQSANASLSSEVASLSSAVQNWPTPSSSATSSDSSSSATSSASGPNIVEFVIPAGTGSGPWNTSANPLIVHVGDTLRVTNGDSIEHQVHADGCIPHEPSPLPPGGSWDTATASCSPGPYTMYDHLYGQTATFYVQFLA